MKEQDLWKLTFTINRFQNFVKATEELQAQRADGRSQFDQGCATGFKTVNNSLKPLIADLEETLAELKTKTEPFLIEDIDFYGDEESA
jgi:hypothetical protein